MITHPDKLLFPDDGITKGEVAAYYAAMAPYLLSHLRRRPITMERYPSGIGGKGFLQKDVVKGCPQWLRRVAVPKKGGITHYALVGDRRSLEWLVNQNTLGIHVWTSRVPRLKHPDVCVIDLDPSIDDPAGLRTVTLAVREAFADCGYASVVKTSGSKGFHVAARLKPRATFRDAGALADRVAAWLMARHPDLVTREFAKADRGRRILIDTGRNRPGATFAAPYTVRPKPGAPVSAPCTWEEIAQGAVHPQTFRMRAMAARIRNVGDLWSVLGLVR